MSQQSDEVDSKAVSMFTTANNKEVYVSLTVMQEIVRRFDSDPEESDTHEQTQQHHSPSLFHLLQSQTMELCEQVRVD
jgi:hypothetical protein